MSTVKRDWRRYNECCSIEFEGIIKWLRSLRGTSGYHGIGRPPVNQLSVLKAFVLKEYFHCAYRQLIGHLKVLKDKIGMGHIPHFNTIRKYLVDSEFIKWVTEYSRRTGWMLKDAETIFSLDSTGFGTSAKKAWVDIRYKKPDSQNDRTTNQNTTL